MFHFRPLLGPHLGSLWRLNRVKKGALKARGLQTPQKSTHVHTGVPKRDPKRLLFDRFLETVLQKFNALPVHLLRQVYGTCLLCQIWCRNSAPATRTSETICSAARAPPWETVVFTFTVFFFTGSQVCQTSTIFHTACSDHSLKRVTHITHHWSCWS